MLIATKTRIVGLITFDLGEIESLEKIKETLTRRGSPYSVGFLRLNSQYFNTDYCKPLLHIKAFSNTQIVMGQNHQSDIHQSDSGEVTSTISLLDKTSFCEDLYLSASGIGCLFFLVEIQRPLNTDQILKIANFLVKYNSTLSLRDAGSFSIDSRVSEYKNQLSQFVLEHRTNYVRRYSLIHLVELSPETIQTAELAGKTLYDEFERDFHALGVRTIEQWQERYPKGVHYREGNTSLSPAGVLKMNMRNTLIYEYPYDDVEIEQLYYPAMIELRIRDMVATSQLQFIQQALARYEAEDYKEVSLQLIEKLQKRTIRTFNEFDGFYLSTSKRVRNLYLQAFRVFHINEILKSLEDKTRYLDNVLLRIQGLSAQRKQQEIISYQSNQLSQASEAADKQAATKFVLDVIGILAGLSLALTVVQTFNLSGKWRFIIIGIFAVIYTMLFAWGKLRTKRVVFRERRSVHVQLEISREDAIRNLLQGTRAKQIKEISIDHDRITWVYEKKSFGIHMINKVEIAFHLAGITEKFNALISIESDIKSRRKWLPPESLSTSVDDNLREVLQMLSLRTDLVIVEAKPIMIPFYE